MKKSDLQIQNETIISVDNVEVTGLKKLYASFFVSGTKETDTFFMFSDETSMDFTTRLLSDNGEVKVEVSVPEGAKKITLICKRDEKYYAVTEFKISVLKKASLLLQRIGNVIKRGGIVFGRGMRFLWREHHFLIPPSMWKEYFSKFFRRIKERGEILLNPYIPSDYEKWILDVEQESSIQNLSYNPLISILIPVYNVESKYLTECLDSILNQNYSNFEVCIVDDCSKSEETLATLKEYEQKDSRIRVTYRKENGHISKATNDALAMARGEFIGLVDNDDVLHKNALYENVMVLNQNKELDFIYSDEDKLDARGNRCEPHFKPDYSPNVLLGLNYICHFAVIRKNLVVQIGGFRVGFEGAQDHDLFLRLVEQTNKIYHIPKILYHWRMIEGSTASGVDNKGYAIEKGKRAIEEALVRRNLHGKVSSIIDSTVYQIEYTMESEPLVSIIIPTRDFADITRTCLASIYEKTTYQNYEVLLVDNNSVEESSFALFKEYQASKSNFRVIKADMEFNYSAINNLAASQAKGEYLVLLNNDTKVISPDWLTTMISYASQDHIGAVGPKLLYPDNTIQHAGVLLGLGGGVACHAFLEEPDGKAGVYGRLLIPYHYSAVTAACLAVSKAKFEMVGGLEEELKVAYNDMDFNLKLLKAGYFNICLPQVSLIHYESKSRGLDSTGEKYKLFLKESNYMYNKWGKFIQNDPFYNPNFSKKGLFMLDREPMRSNNDEI